MSTGNGYAPHGQPDAPLTPVEEWQRLRVHGMVKVLEATGRVVRWRPVNLTRMLKDGKVPDHLTGYVARRLWLGTPDEERSDQEKLVDWMEYHELVAKASLLYPVVTDDPQGPDEIHPDDLLDDELVEIERMARNPADEVRRFRGEQAGDVGAVSEGGQVVEAA